MSSNEGQYCSHTTTTLQTKEVLAPNCLRRSKKNAPHLWAHLPLPPLFHKRPQEGNRSVCVDQPNTHTHTTVGSHLGRNRHPPRNREFEFFEIFAKTENVSFLAIRICNIAEKCHGHTGEVIIDHRFYRKLDSKKIVSNVCFYRWLIFLVVASVLQLRESPSANNG